MFKLVFKIALLLILSGQVWGDALPLQLRIDSTTKLTATGGEPEEMRVVARTNYDLNRKGSERQFIFRGIDVWMRAGTEVTLDISFTGEAMTIRKPEANSISVDKAPADLKQLLKDSYGNVLYSYVADEEGRAKEGKFHAGAGAQKLVDDGQIDNARVFHAPFPKELNRWEAPVKIGMGEGGFATGTLAYEKVKVSDRYVEVNVTGKAEAKLDKPTTRVASYEIKGKQYYDTQVKEYVGGRLDMEVKSVTVTDGVKTTGVGTTIWTLQPRKVE
jgi:hypothetical protein